MEILKAIINLLWALFAIGTLIVLIVYFKSISTFLSAISNMAKEAGVIDWGKRGKYRRQLNKLMKITEAESQLLSESATEQPNVSPNAQEERIKQLEFNIGTLNKQLLVTTTVAATTTSDFLNSESVQFLENIREQAHDYVMEEHPDSDLVKLADVIIKFCSVCKWGTKMSMYDVPIEDPFYAGPGYIKCEKDQQKHSFSYSCDKWELP